MGELLLRKAILVRDRIAKLRGALPNEPEDVRRDERLEAPVGLGHAEHFLAEISTILDEV